MTYRPVMLSRPGSGLPGPGLRTARLYVWSVIVSPLLLLLGGVACLVVGLAWDSEGVAVLGAAALLASLILPRMKGPFKFGVSGVEGNLIDAADLPEVFRLLQEDGVAPGKAAELAIDMVADSKPAPAAVSRAIEDVGLEFSDTLRSSRVRSRSLEKEVSATATFEREVEAVVARVSDGRGWPLSRQYSVRNTSPTRVDFVLQTKHGVVIVESAAIRRSPEALVARVTRLEQESRALAASEAVLVVPDGGISGRLGDVIIVELRGLETLLSSLDE